MVHLYSDYIVIMATQGFGFMGFSAFYSSAKKTSQEQGAAVFRFDIIELLLQSKLPVSELTLNTTYLFNITLLLL